MAPHSSTLVWRIPWMEEPGGLQSRKESGTTERLHFTSSLEHWTVCVSDLKQDVKQGSLG